MIPPILPTTRAMATPANTAVAPEPASIWAWNVIPALATANTGRTTNADHGATRRSSRSAGSRPDGSGRAGTSRPATTPASAGSTPPAASSTHSTTPAASTTAVVSRTVRRSSTSPTASTAAPTRAGTEVRDE